MDPTLNTLAYKLYPEMPEQASHHQEIYLEEVHRLRYGLGSLLVNIGQKLQARELHVPTLCDPDANDCVGAVG